MSHTEVLNELKKANLIISKLARLVKHYGYVEEIPYLRERERRAAIAEAEVQK